MSTVTTEEQLLAAVKKQQESIIIEGDLASKTIKIQVTGKVAWIIAIGATGLAAYYLITQYGKESTRFMEESPYALLSAHGIPIIAILIAVAAAVVAVGTVKKLRPYKVISRTKERLVLKRK